MISISSQKSPLFIDGSYFVFYRFFATNVWFKKQNIEVLEEKKLASNMVFKEKFTKIFEQTLQTLCKKFGVEWDAVYFVKDCSRENIWRNKHFKGYKELRDQNVSEDFDGDIFKYTYTDLLPSLKSKYKFNMIEYDQLEADDVIALLKRGLHQKNPSLPINIITNDNDYIQLVDDNTFIYNLQFKRIEERVKQEPSKYLEYKIIMGDKSDNIPAIMKKCGPKTAEKLIESPENLDTFFKKHPEALEQYTLNRMLIDFNYIDEKLKNAFLKTIKIV